MDESEGGFPFCPSSQVSKLQDPSEWSGRTVLIHWCYFSSQMYPYGALFHYSGEKQRSPLPNLTRKNNNNNNNFRDFLLTENSVCFADCI